MKLVKIALGALVVLVVLAVVGVRLMTAKANTRLERKWAEVAGVDVPVPWPLSDDEKNALREQRRLELASAAAVAGAGEAAPPPADVDALAGVDLDAIAKERALARGKHLLEARVGCAECHGADYGGRVILESGPMGVWSAPNITAAGVAKDYRPRDWDLIVRHGIAKDGTSTTMPAIDHAYLSDRDLSDLITVITSAPPVERVSTPNKLGPLRGVLIATGGIPIAVEIIDHQAPRPKLPPAEAANVEFGKYVAEGCVGCHGLNYAGGPVPGGDPAWPEASNLTPDASGLAGWSIEQFRVAMREGKSKDGRALLEPMKGITVMTSKLTETELEAMFAFLQSLPPTGGKGTK